MSDLARQVPGGVGGETVTTYTGPPELAHDVQYRTPVEAAAQVQHILASVANEVLNAENAVARAREQGRLSGTVANTASWVRSRLEALREFVETHPAAQFLPRIRAMAVEISESANAARVLAERTNTR